MRVFRKSTAPLGLFLLSGVLSGAGGSTAFAMVGSVYGSELRGGDPCAGVPKPTDAAKTAVHIEVVRKTLECLARVRAQVQAVDAALELYRRYDWDSEHPTLALSSLSDETLQSVVEQEMRWLLIPRGAGASRAAELQLATELQGKAHLGWRKGFSSPQLDEMERLSHRFRRALEAFRRDVIAAVSPRLVSFEREEKAISQLAPSERARSRVQWLLLAYRAGSTRATDRWLEEVEALSRIGGLNPARAPEGVTPEWIAVLLPYLAVPSLPSETEEAVQIPPQMDEADQPLRAASLALSRVFGASEKTRKLQDRYRELVQRESALSENYDGPVFSTSSVQHAARAKPVRVAFMDSGVDPEAFPTFKRWLSSGGAGHVVHRDFADGDDSPWAPFEVDEFLSAGHGSSILSIFSAVLGDWNRALLDPAQLEVGIWKVQSTRQSLIANPWGRSLWNDQHIPYWAIKSVMSPAVRPVERPQIVSASLYFPMAEFLILGNTPRLLLDAPWLWVMSAGNSGRDVSDLTQGRSCFGDVASESRPDARILCVGGVIPGVEGVAIAPYSNTGSRVDVYASVFQSPFCNRGTSCATPVVTAAATALLSLYPSLKPEQLKRIIVEASHLRTLPVCQENGRCPEPLVTHQVRYFEPRTCMPRAVARARALVLERTNSDQAPDRPRIGR